MTDTPGGKKRRRFWRRKTTWFAMAFLAWKILPLLSSGYTVSKKTTYLTGPLDKDGFVDYVAALDAMYADGTSDLNNAGMAILLAVDPGVLGPNAILHEAKIAADIGPRLRALPDMVYGARLSELMKRGWTGAQEPELAQWLDDNKAAIDRIAEASGRPRFYVPLAKLPNGLYMWDGGIPWDAFRLAGEALTLRATYRAAVGDVHGAWGDVMAGQRLGRAVTQQPIGAGEAMGFSIAIWASDAAAVVISQNGIDAKRARAMLHDLAFVTSFIDLTEVYDREERLTLLSAFTFRDWNIATPIQVRLVDFNAMARNSNHYHNQVVAALKQDTWREKESALAAVKWQPEQDSKAMLLAKVMFGDGATMRRAYSQKWASFIAGMVPINPLNILKYQGRTLATHDMMHIALGLVAYRADHGALPDRLDVLTEYLDKIPVDPFTGKGYEYQHDAAGFRLRSAGPDSASEADDITYHVGKTAATIPTP